MVVVRETTPLLSNKERQVAVRAVMKLEIPGKGLIAACEFVRVTLEEGDRYCKGEISKDEFLAIQDQALLCALEKMAEDANGRNNNV